MKKLLFVNCCVRKASRTKRLADRFFEALSEEFEIEEVFVPSLGLSPLDEAALEKRDAAVLSGDFSLPDFENAKKFAAADFIVIAAPFWDCSFPSMLRVYIENVSVNGLSFGYNADGSVKKLCAAKELLFITTAGGFLKSDCAAKRYFGEYCAMLGIENFRFVAAQGLDVFPDKVDETIEKTAKREFESFSETETRHE